MNIAFAGLRHGHIYVLYNMAKEHKDYNITGAFEADDAARAQAEQNGVACKYNSYQELLADDEVEVVALGGCYGDRGKMAIEALGAGKHVISDKPLCTRLEELDEIQNAAAKNNKMVSCMLTMRYEPMIIAVKSLIASGELGEINNIYFGGQHPLQYGRRPAWYFEEGKHGGVISDIAIHGIDILKYWFDGAIDTINGARCWNKYAESEPSFKDSAQLMLTMTNGAGVIADVSYAIPDGIEFGLPYYWDFTVWGTKGTLRFSLADNETKYYVKGDAESKTLCKADGEFNYLSDFLDMISGRDSILTIDDVFETARETLEIQKYADELI